MKRKRERRRDVAALDRSTGASEEQEGGGIVWGRVLGEEGAIGIGRMRGGVRGTHLGRNKNSPPHRSNYSLYHNAIPTCQSFTYMTTHATQTREVGGVAGCLNTISAAAGGAQRLGAVVGRARGELTQL
jgi:hypothetical protein